MAVVEVVKYDGNPNTFAWKYPNSELGTWTQLIVNDSQEAVLFKGGQALDVFAGGRHTLETANIPILNRIINIPFGGKSPFAAEVWFVNKAYSLDIKWGTPTPIQLQDPKYKVFVPLRSFGQFGIQIDDSKKFLLKLVSTLSVFDKDSIIRYFRGLYLTKAKDSISSYLIKKQISVLEINAYLDELSEHLKEKMSPVFDEYGIKLLNFYVNDINVPEDDTAVIKLKNALAKKAEMDIIGYNYTQERSFDTLEGAATNQSSNQSGLMGAGIGLGMGVGIGGAFGQQMGGLTQNINTNNDIQENKKCINCNADMERSQRFCGSCGFDTSDKKEDVQSTDDKIICSICGHAFLKSMKFCPQCGDIYKPCVFCGADLKSDELVCPGCGRELPKACAKCGASIYGDMKFCHECGISLIKKCSVCKSEIKGNPKFCPECGNKL